MKKKVSIVKKVTEKTMDGDNLLIKRINAYLTKQFILSSNVPSDECLPEARHIVELCCEYLLGVNHEKKHARDISQHPDGFCPRCGSFRVCAHVL